MSLDTEARLFLRSTHTGILSTFSAKYVGYPFGSVAPFVLNHQAEPIILISTLAEHTKNIAANPKVSLLVFAGAEDLQANARLTLIGEALPCDKQDEDLRARYLRYIPQAASYFDMHDFSFYRIAIHQARYIAGFGKMSWLQGPQLLQPENQLASQESSIIEHMNQDHADSLLAYCQHYHQVNASSATMLGIDSDGFDLEVSIENQKRRLRFDFAEPIHDAISARTALVGMSRAARA